MKKQGQIQLSFNMIFSIILIIVFLGFGIFAIMKFLGMQKATLILEFKTDLQEDVNNIWKSSKASQKVSYSLPESIKEVCFFDYNEDLTEKYRDISLLIQGEENMAFFPIGSGDGNDVTKINHLDISKIISEQNPYCIEVNKGKISMTLSKNYEDALVFIS